MKIFYMNIKNYNSMMLFLTLISPLLIYSMDEQECNYKHPRYSDDMEIELPIVQQQDILSEIAKTTAVYKSVVDANGGTMSKSLGTVVFPQEMTKKLGTNSLRCEEDSFCDMFLNVFDLQPSYDMSQQSIATSSSSDQPLILSDNNQPPYFCNQCNKSFSRKKKLSQHIQERHTIYNDAENYCSLCNKYFSSKTRLNEHMIYHREERPHECNQCEKKYKTAANLLTHIKSSHTKPYHCNLCNKNLSSNYSLKNHIKLHAEQREFECDQCAKKFITKDSLKTHKEKTHLMRTRCLIEELNKTKPDIDQIISLIQKGAHPNASNEFHCNALHIAAQVGDAEDIQQLLELHVDPLAHTTQMEGYTPLELAQLNNNVACIIILNKWMKENYNAQTKIDT
jgi:hypothetical protein